MTTKSNDEKLKEWIESRYEPVQYEITHPGDYRGEDYKVTIISEKFIGEVLWQKVRAADAPTSSCTPPTQRNAPPTPCNIQATTTSPVPLHSTKSWCAVPQG